MALPALLLVLAVALAAVDLGLAQVRALDAARTGARLLARGEPPGTALGAARRAAPADARVAVTTVGDRVRVSVTGSVPAVLRPLGLLPRPSATAEARLESLP